MGVLAKPIPFGDYFLLEKINTGGMAEVYKAKTFGAEGFERVVAVKKILPSIAEDKEFISMFVNEAKLAVQLTHANIAQINDLGNINGDYYIAMEYVPGHDLRVIFDRCVRTGQKLDIACVCYIVSKVCEGLDYAHNKKDANGNPMNIIHRDISPQNILISYDGECKLIDFGIAKASTQSNATQVGILKGKFSYMSPEQVSGKTNIDRRSDIFALGIVLFEMLTLKRLFLGQSDFETLEKIRKVEVSPPTLYNSAIPEELEDIVLKALEKDVTQRYQSAQELQEALQRFMFKQNMYYTAKDLSEFMHAMFAQEIALEQKKTEFYKELTRDVLMESKKSEAAEDETAFYDNRNIPRVSGIQYESANGQPAPKQAIYAELDDFQPPAGDDIVFSSKNNSPSSATDNVNKIISAPVMADRPAPVPRKSLAAESVIVNKGRETVLTSPVAQKKSNRRPVFFTIACVLVAIIIALLIWWAVRPKDANDGLANFTILPEGIRVSLEINDNTRRDGLLSPVVIENLSTTKATRYRLTADGYEASDGSFIASKEGKDLQIKLKPIHPSLLSIYVDLDMADVAIDGVKLEGNKRFEVKDLAPGQHVLRVTKEGYVPYEARFEFTAGEKKSITPELRPKYATLILKTTKYEATYKLRNRRTGETRTGTFDPRGVNISELEASDTYDITVNEGRDDAQTVEWKPDIKLANGSVSKLFPTTYDPNAKPTAAPTEPVAVAAQKTSPAKSSAPAASPGKSKKSVGSPANAAKSQPAETNAAAASAGAPGIFQIISKPPANIFINGKDYGSTPKKLELPAGSYKIRFVNTEAGINSEQTVTLGAGEIKKVTRN